MGPRRGQGGHPNATFGTAHTRNGLRVEVSGTRIFTWAFGGPSAAVDSARFASQGAALLAAMRARMWREDVGMFCDGICEEVGNHTGVVTNAWTLYMGLLPEAAVPGAWAQIAAWGLEGFGDYGAHIYLSALANSYPDGDDGSSMGSPTLWY